MCFQRSCLAAGFYFLIKVLNKGGINTITFFLVRTCMGSSYHRQPWFLANHYCLAIEHSMQYKAIPETNGG